MVEAVLGLTPAESRVVAARTAGQSVVEIAEGLSCAESTVRTHLKRVHRKLGIRNQTNSCIESCRWKP
ncbi:helix-turn-helix transcriptional regulator [Candidatus Palauibacter sp.]